MLHSNVLGFEGRSHHPSCIKASSYVGIRKHKQISQIRETYPYLRSYPRENPTLAQYHRPCAKKAYSSGPAAVLISRIRAFALGPALTTNPAKATHSPGHTALPSRCTHLYAVRPVSAMTRLQHSEKPMKPFSPRRLHTRLLFQ